MWQQYAHQYSGLICDMIADLLHLTATEGGDPTQRLGGPCSPQRRTTSHCGFSCRRCFR
jgi:hypothetical protein